MWKTILQEKYSILFLDEEFRVRNQIGCLVKQIIASNVTLGLTHFDTLKTMLLTNINQTFDRDGN